MNAKELLLTELEKLTEHSHRDIDFNKDEDVKFTDDLVSEFYRLMCKASDDDVLGAVNDQRFDAAYDMLSPQLRVRLTQCVLRTSEIENGKNNIQKIQIFHAKTVNRFLAIFNLKSGIAGGKTVMPPWLRPSVDKRVVS
jgi:hypothetical protein